MDWWKWAILIAYGFVSTGLFVYALHMYVMVLLFVAKRRRPPAPPPADSDWPAVTVQLPIYNEKWVARRVIQSACALEYPRLEVQVLDDSTDETRRIVDEEAARQRQRGLAVQVLRRENREGFKAGALQHGLHHATGEFIAIFDADFVPAPDWLKRAVPELLTDPLIGWVQTRWGHLNAEESWVTRAQALGIDGHFGIEQPARVRAGLMANFNGTAGVWRKAAIQDAGGWSGDTLTEDLDLSYRAQLKGWKMAYRSDLVVPAEIPSVPSSIKSQQFRWAKGSIQTARKLLRPVWQSNLGVVRKIMATVHLLSYAIHPLMLLSVLLSLPMLAVVRDGRVPGILLAAGSVMFALGTTAPFVMYGVAQFSLYPRPWRRLLALPVLMSLGMAIALKTTRAVLEGLFGVPSAFVRTPKRGDDRKDGTYRVSSGLAPLWEVLLGMACGGMVFVYAAMKCYPVAVLMGIYSSGFISLGILGWRETGRSGGRNLEPIQPAASAINIGP